ncbi:hypothetical protein D3C72_2529370 [compost metagenome]
MVVQRIPLCMRALVCNREVVAAQQAVAQAWMQKQMSAIRDTNIPAFLAGAVVADLQ